MDKKLVIVELLEQACRDQTLLTMTPFLSENWRDFIPIDKLSKPAIKLMDRLEELYPALSSATFRAGGSTEMINPAFLAIWLTRRSQTVSPEDAYNSLVELERDSEVTGYHVTLINGLDFNSKIEFDNGICLVNSQGLPQEIRGGVSAKILANQRDVHPPYSFLYQPIRLKVLSEQLDKETRQQMRGYVDDEYSIVNFLTLFSKKHAMCIDKRWLLLPDKVPMSGLIDSWQQSYLEIRPPRVHESWRNVDINEVSQLYRKYRDVPEELRLPLDVSIGRRAQAMNTWNDTNKAIDLGIALEAVLTARDTRDQLALQIRTLGAKIASEDTTERHRIFSLLKTIYAIRSQAVHNGHVKSEYKIKNVGLVPTADILEDGLSVLGHCLKEIIKRQGLSQLDVEQLMLG